jgi:hypothetical protein
LFLKIENTIARVHFRRKACSEDNCHCSKDSRQDVEATLVISAVAVALRVFDPLSSDQMIIAIITLLIMRTSGMPINKPLLFSADNVIKSSFETSRQFFEYRKFFFWSLFSRKILSVCKAEKQMKFRHRIEKNLILLILLSCE